MLPGRLQPNIRVMFGVLPDATEGTQTLRW